MSSPNLHPSPLSRPPLERERERRKKERKKKKEKEEGEKKVAGCEDAGGEGRTEPVALATVSLRANEDHASLLPRVGQVLWRAVESQVATLLSTTCMVVSMTAECSAGIHGEVSPAGREFRPFV